MSISGGQPCQDRLYIRNTYSSKYQLFVGSNHIPYRPQKCLVNAVTYSSQKLALLPVMSLKVAFGPFLIYIILM